MADEELKAKIAVLEERLRLMALEERLSKVAVLDERYSFIQLELQKQNDLSKKCQDDVAKLKADRDTLSAFGKVIAGFGLTGAVVVGFFFYQLTQTEALIGKNETRIKDAETHLAGASDKIDWIQKSLSSGLQPQIQQAQDTLNQFVGTKLKENLPDLASQTLSKITGITFLERSQLKIFVEHLDPTPDPIIKSMTNDGSDFPCESLAPAQAKGAIIKVMIVGTGSGNHAFASFVCADPQGNFTTDHTHENALTNYSASWIGGTLFCPFCYGKKIRFRLDSNASTADQTIACIATIVGWF
jgi:hypothetical protein